MDEVVIIGCRPTIDDVPLQTITHNQAWSIVAISALIGAVYAYDARDVCGGLVLPCGVLFFFATLARWQQEQDEQE